MVDPDLPTPVWRQLYQLLRQRIESGEIPPGRPIPSMAQLVAEHQLARGTVAKAVAQLVGDGLVYPVPGKGMYVRQREAGV